MNVISAQDIHKHFRVYFDKSSTLKERLLFWKRNRYEDHMVLKGVSFDIPKGESVGLIGENGSGKSTLLKLLTQIIYPDQGSIRVEGRVSSLLELGAGFHPDLSGRENIYTNASIFGLTRKEIDQSLEEIIEFSELGEFIDNPVRTYSSGMYMRLAFSVAIHVQADILLIDEILAVGDANFQSKCFDELRRIKARGVTIVIVSHALNTIEQFCDRSIWLEDGVIRMSGPPRQVHPYYMDYMGAKRHAAFAEKPAEPPVEAGPPEESVPQEEETAEANPNRFGSRQVEITSIQLCDKTGADASDFMVGDPMTVRLTYKRHDPSVSSAVVGVGIFRNDGVNCYGVNTAIDHLDVPLSDSGEVCCSFHALNLLGGEYLLDVAFHMEDGFNYDYIRECRRFTVFSAISDVGVARLEHRWSVQGSQEMEQ